jgi:hypothetical protein
MSQLHLHFDGTIAKDHFVSLRTLGSTLYHLQAAVNRAHLDTKFGEVWKGARLSQEDYALTELWTQPPRDGGYIIEFIEKSERIKKTLTRLVTALTPAVEKAKTTALQRSGTLVEQSVRRAEQVRVGTVEPNSFDKFLPSAAKNPYGDRAINKEIDQMIGVLRNQNAGASTLQLAISTDATTTYDFNRSNSENFHSLVSRRILGDPLIFSVKVIELDSKNRSAKVENITTERSIKLHYGDDAAFTHIKQYLGTGATMNFVGGPVYEGGAFDAKGGDVFFIGPV